MNGSQGGSTVGVMDGMAEVTGVGGREVTVGTIVSVTTTVGSAAVGPLTQETRMKTKKTLNIRFINGDLESASLLAKL